MKALETAKIEQAIVISLKKYVMDFIEETKNGLNKLFKITYGFISKVIARL